MDVGIYLYLDWHKLKAKLHRTALPFDGLISFTASVILFFSNSIFRFRGQKEMAEPKKLLCQEQDQSIDAKKWFRCEGSQSLLFGATNELPERTSFTWGNDWLLRDF